MVEFDTFTVCSDEDLRDLLLVDDMRDLECRKRVFYECEKLVKIVAYAFILP